MTRFLLSLACSPALLLCWSSPCAAIERNVASQKVTVFAFDAATGLPKTGDAANITVYVQKDGGSVTALTDTSASEQSGTNAPGCYLFDLSQGETDAKDLTFTGKSTTANVIVVQRTYTTTAPNQSKLTVTSTGSVDLGQIDGDPSFVPNLNSFFEDGSIGGSPLPVNVTQVEGNDATDWLSRLVTRHSNVVWIGTGDDAEAVIEAQTAGTLCFLAPGTHALAGDQLVIPAGVSVVGAGVDETTVTGTRVNSPQIIPGDNTRIASMTLKSLNTGIESSDRMLGIASGSFEAAVFEDLRVFGLHDGISFTSSTPCSGLLKNVTVNTHQLGVWIQGAAHHFVFDGLTVNTIDDEGAQETQGMILAGDGAVYLGARVVVTTQGSDGDPTSVQIGMQLGGSGTSGRIVFCDSQIAMLGTAASQYAIHNNSSVRAQFISCDFDRAKGFGKFDDFRTLPSTHLVSRSQIASVTDQNTFTITAGPPNNSAVVGGVAIITDQVNGAQKSYVPIASYTGSTKTLDLVANPVFTVEVGDYVDVVAGTGLPTDAIGAAQLATTGLDEIQANLEANGVTLTAEALDDVNAECDTALADYGPLKPTTPGQTLDVNANGAAEANLTELMSTLLTQSSAGRLAGNFSTYWNNDNAATTAVVDDTGGGGGGTTDWTATERNQIRHRLGINGTSAAPSATPSLLSLAQLEEKIEDQSTFDDLVTSNSDLQAILDDTNELQADWAESGRLDLVLDGRASQASVDAAASNAATAATQATTAATQSTTAAAQATTAATQSTNAASTATAINTKLGTPAGASVSEDIAEISVDVGEVEVDEEAIASAVAAQADIAAGLTRIGLALPAAAPGSGSGVATATNVDAIDVTPTVEVVGGGPFANLPVPQANIIKLGTLRDGTVGFDRSVRIKAGWSGRRWAVDCSSQLAQGVWLAGIEPPVENTNDNISVGTTEGTYAVNRELAIFTVSAESDAVGTGTVTLVITPQAGEEFTIDVPVKVIQ